MSIDANPSIKEIATTFGDTPPYSMSELYGLNFSSGNAVTSGTISLSGFRNKTVELIKSKITASNGISNDRFGSGVALSGDGSTAAVSAYKYNSGRGVVYIFENVNGVWTEQAKLTTSGSATNDYFGRYTISISENGSTVLASSIRVSAAYIFEKPGTGWSDMTQTSKLTVSNNSGLYEYFGRSHSMSSDGTTVVVGAGQNDDGGYNQSGVVCIYEKPGTGWPSSMTETCRLTATDAGTNHYLGESVSMTSDGSTVLAGAYLNSSIATFQGAAYIFERGGSGWSNMTETAKLTSSDGVAGDYFGYTVSISGDGSTAVVGATYDDSDQGSVYIFEKPETGWPSSGMTLETPTLTESNRATYNHFSASLSVSGDGSKLIVGTRFSEYYFEKINSTWIERGKFTRVSGGSSSDGSSFSSFSRDGSRFIVGIHLDDVTTNGVTNTDQGSAYIYETSYFVS